MKEKENIYLLPEIPEFIIKTCATSNYVLLLLSAMTKVDYTVSPNSSCYIATTNHWDKSLMFQIRQATSTCNIRVHQTHPPKTQIYAHTFLLIKKM